MAELRDFALEDLKLLLSAVQRASPIPLRRGRRKAPVPAALAPGVVEHLSPSDPLRLRFVISDPEVCEAFRMARSTREKLVQALDREIEGVTQETIDASAAALRVHQTTVREVLGPAILRAEARRRLQLARNPPTHADLASRVVTSIDGDLLLAMDKLFRRNPHWRDLAVWSARDCAPYLAKAATTEARFIAARSRRADRRVIVRGQISSGGPSEETAIKLERARQKKIERGMRLVRELRGTLPINQRRVLDEMNSGKCGAYRAATRLGLGRGVAVALLARAERFHIKQTQNVRKTALH